MLDGRGIRKTSSTLSAGTRWRKTEQAPGWERHGGFAIAILLHVGVFWAVLQMESVQRAIIAAAPIMVNFISPPKVEEPPPTPAARAPVKAASVTIPPPILTTSSEQSASPMIAVPTPKGIELPPLGTAPSGAAPVMPPGFTAAYLHNPAPVYPAAARRNREEGKVLLRVYVSPAGTAEKIEIQTSSRSPRLDQAALEAVRAWRFVPARQGDTPVAAWVIVPINFALEG